jgi:hypothetical protein
MTVTVTPSRYPTQALCAHSYRVPVVRELPPRLVDARDATTW